MPDTPPTQYDPARVRGLSLNPYRRHPTPYGMTLPDTRHLPDEDAALVEDLYVELYSVSRGEVARVRNDMATAVADPHQPAPLPLAA